MGLRDKFRSAWNATGGDIREGVKSAVEDPEKAAYDVADKAREIKGDVVVVVEKVKSAVNKIRTLAETLRVDPKVIREDRVFREFLERNYNDYGSLDEDQDRGKIRERYVLFQKAKKAKEKLGALHAGQIEKGITLSPEQITASLDAHFDRLVQNDPEAIGIMLRTIEKAEKSEARVKEQEQIQQQYAAEGGIKGLQEKLKTLETANKRKGRVSGWISRKLGIHQYDAARKMLQNEYRIDMKDVKSEIKKVKEQIKTYAQAEKQKERIKTQAGFAREQVFETSTAARLIREEAEELLIEQVDRYMRFGSVENMEKAQELLESASQRGIGKENEEIENVRRGVDRQLEEAVRSKLEQIITSASEDLLAARLRPWLRRNKLGVRKGREVYLHMRTELGEVIKESGIEPAKERKGNDILKELDYLVKAAA
jgi:hypothetical protein